MTASKKVVFLIDRGLEPSKGNLICINIHLTCLRILTYFAHASYTLDIKPSVFWGFKFYESRKRNYTHLYKQNPFYEYSVSRFQEFEKELYENLHNEFDVIKSIKKVSQKTFPGDCFRDALQEIISDYQWDRPELFSPAKLKDRTYRSKTNYIIVFSYSANIINKNSFENFDLEKRFIDLLLPDTLRSKMRNLGITLCWVDIGSEWNTQEVYYKCSVHLSTHVYKSDFSNINTESQRTFNMSFCLKNRRFTKSNTKEKIINLKQQGLSDKCSSSLSQLKDHLKKINGVVFDLSTISSLWLRCHGETIYYRDMLSTSSLLNGLLSPDAQRKVDKCRIYSCTLSNGSSLDKRATLTLFTQATNKLFCQLMDDPAASSLRIVKELSHSDIQLHLISSLVKPCFFVLRSDKGSNMKKLILEKKVLKVCLTCDAGEKMAVLIPYTYHAGVFLMLTKQQKEGTLDVNMDQQGIVNRNFQEEDSKLKEIFDECGNRDCGTSLVNIIDPWFASNMKLGFPMNTKKHFKVRDKEDHEIEKAREENSKQIIDFIKSKFKKEKEDMEREELQLKTVERPLVKKRANMKGVTWARWRLMEYHRKKNLETSKREIKNLMEENNPGTMADIEMKIDDVTNLKEFDSTSDLSTYCQQECKKLLEKVSFCFYESMVMLKTIEKHFDDISQPPDKNKKEKIIEFVDEHILSSTVRSKLEENDMDKIADLYLLQVNIVFAVVKTFCNDECESYYEKLTKKVVSLCRSITFIKSALFIQDYLKKALLPRYVSSVPNFMTNIYEDLMLDVPDELEKATSERAAETSPFRPIQQPSSLLSIYDSDTSSVGSVQNSRRPLRRRPSIFNESSNQKVIAIPFKPKQKTSKKNKEKNMPTTPSSKRRRRKAETPRKKVPDTPEAKQVNDMIWKKQERERRHSFVDKKMKPIEESPMKDIMSPTKSRPSLYRSKSFQTFTSPRSFYTLQRRPSLCVKKFDGKPEHRAGYLKSERNHAATIHSKENEEPHEISKDRSFLSQNIGSIIKKKPLQRRKSSLLLNFEEPEPQGNVKSENKSISSQEFEKESESIEYESKKVTRRNIFSDKSSLTSRGTSSSISSNASSGSMKRKHSSTDLHVKKFKCSVDNNDDFENISGEFEFKLFGKDLKNKRNDEINFGDLVSDIYQDQNSTAQETGHGSDEHSQRIDAIKQGKIKSTNENTVDWLNLIEKEQADYENEEPVIMASFSKHGDKPFEEEVKSSPTIVKAGDDSISVSPCILLSSLQTLEKAPILSPSYHRKDTPNRRQRRKNLATEYDE